MDFTDRFVDFEGAWNVRDLGGLPAADGEVRRGRVYRADSPQLLTSADRTRVEALAVRHVIDLRSGAEAEEGSWAVNETMRHGVYEVIDPAQVIGAGGGVSLPDPFDDEAFAHRYLKRLREGGAVFVEAAQTLTHGIDDGVIFHCSAGKDRTGLLAAFVLSALGVDRDLIVADYAASHEPMQRKFAWREANPQPGDRDLSAFPAKLIEAPAAVMERTLELADAEFGGIVACFQQAGFTDDDLATLRRSLLV